MRGEDVPVCLVDYLRFDLGSFLNNVSEKSLRDCDPISGQFLVHKRSVVIQGLKLVLSCISIVSWKCCLNLLGWFNRLQSL